MPSDHALRFSGLLLLVALTAPSVLAQSTQSRLRFLHWAYQDAAGLVEQVNGKTPLYVLGAGATLSVISLLDANVDHRIRGDYSGPVGDFLEFTNHLGGPEMNVPVAGLFLVSLATDDARFQDAAFTSLQAMVYAGALSYGLKYTVGRFRPFQETGPYRFAPFSGNSSFPSGHTVTAFAILTPWVLYYPHPVTYSLFALSTGTAVARIAREKHWATDVLAGGTIGFLTAYYLTKQHQGAHPGLVLTPTWADGTPGVSLRVQF